MQLLSRLCAPGKGAPLLELWRGPPPGLLVRERRMLAVCLWWRTIREYAVNPRLRRLENDYREIRTRFDGDPHLRIVPIAPMPPEQYVVTYFVPSLRLDDRNNVTRTSQTVVTITLPAGYPREKPHAVSVDPIFHPNFGAYVCIADFWAPGQSLGDIVASIADMLQFKKYNIRSPLNAVAAEWANENAHSLPLALIAVGERQEALNISIGPNISVALAEEENARD